MQKSALAQEKVWFDKPSYDKAERLYFEKLAKVVSRKLEDSCPLKTELHSNESHKEANNNGSNPSRKKERTKDKENKENKDHKENKENKSLLIENAANEAVISKGQAKEAGKAQKNQEPEEVEEKKRQNNAKSKEKDTSPKPNSKEMKEEKNKADTRRRNRGKGKNNNSNNVEAAKENVPVARNKGHGSNQGTQQPATETLPASGSLANEVAKVRQHLMHTLQCDLQMSGATPAAAAPASKNTDIPKESLELIHILKETVDRLEARLKAVEDAVFPPLPHPYLAVCPAKPPDVEPAEKEEDEDLDLFGSDSEGEDAEAAKIREERLAAYAAKKAKKPVLIAKSSIILDVKPWDDTTDMALMESEVRKIEMNGLLWGAAKLVPLAFGIHKLQISCVVEDDKVSVDELTEKIQEIETYVQSVDIAAFNKI